MHLHGSETIICFSHLRWDFVYQRPQHLLKRLATKRSVFFFEEPLFGDHAPSLSRRAAVEPNVQILTPLLPHGLSQTEQTGHLRALLQGLILAEAIERPILWYYTPLMLAFSDHLCGSAIVYDCMDELSGFRFASGALGQMEKALLARADLVFAGGKSLYESKSRFHNHVHLFPSSVDCAHFAKARRTDGAAPIDQAPVAGPRLGYFGVIDERLDLTLLDKVAAERPDWNIVMVGPVAKLDPSELPRRANIHYLGAKRYDELPAYLAGWDVALMPFALNEATRFISPTKTPEYLAGGKPVVSTAIADVAASYGDVPGVFIADDAASFVAACESALSLPKGGAWLKEGDALLSRMSWDRTADAMQTLICAATAPKSNANIVSLVTRPSDRLRSFDALIVGAGFSGAVLAERLARESGQKVMVIDRRPHVGGNAYDCLDEAGILVHRYGPHIFHTNSQEVFAYLSRFTEWRPYEHRVLAKIDDLLLPMPINRTTINRLYKLTLKTEEDVGRFLQERAEPMDTIRSAEDMVVSSVGRDLYEKFFRGYTRKQWGVDPSELDKSVTARVPARTNADDRYFTDRYQYMPKDGYTRLFENMLDHENISLALGIDFKDVDFSYDRLIYCGPIDEYFGHRLGRLPYRSLQFRHQTLAVEQHQSAAVVNYPSMDVDYTRITEYKYLTGQTHRQTSISYEYPSADGDPYYPIPNAENHALLKQYEALAAREAGVIFAGRLGTYRYYNMDQVVGQALAIYRRLALADRALDDDPAPLAVAGDA